MTYREAWEDIYFKHCQETCDYAYMDNCQEEKCEYYMALQALNRQYYAECGSVWVKPKADRKTENSSEKPNNCENHCGEVTEMVEDEPQYDFGEYADRLWKMAYERGKREALEQTEPQCERMTDEEIDTLLAKTLVGQTGCAWK